jgi:hypothetical protein
MIVASEMRVFTASVPVDQPREMLQIGNGKVYGNEE